MTAPAPSPVFSVKLDVFEGPFDLLLQLIAKHQLDVTTLALSQVTDEFIAHIRALGASWDLGQATEFLVVGLALLAVVRVLTGGITGMTVQLLQYGVGQGIGGGELLLRVLLMVGLMNVFVGALSLVPLPPLDGGRLLFALAPRSAGWQKAEYQLDERNIGIAVVLALLLIPLGGPQALLPVLLDTVVGPLADLVTGGP